LKHQNSIKALFRDGIAALVAHGAAKGDEFPTLSGCLINRSDQGVDIAMKKNILRGVVEGGFIIFLFYSNLLMGEFERSGTGVKRGVVWAIEDVFTAANFEIATIAALIGYVLFEFFRKRF
jgi:hypothetical protein